jgi:hypothetical protein
LVQHLSGESFAFLWHNVLSQSAIANVFVPAEFDPANCILSFLGFIHDIQIMRNFIGFHAISRYDPQIGSAMVAIIESATNDED